MENLALNSEKIEKVKIEAAEMVKTLMGSDLIEIILYGSCARGDYTDDSVGTSKGAFGRCTRAVS